MPSPSLILWADSSRNAFAAGWQSSLDASAIILRQGDSVGVELHWIRRTSNISQVMEEVAWPPSAAITLAVGRLDTAPTAGSFTLSYDGDSTAELPSDVSETAMQTALNALAGITADGGVTVIKTSTTYRVLWNDAMVPSSTISVGSNDLSPTASIGIATARAGGVAIKNLVQLHIKQSPVAKCISWVTQDAPAITVTQVNAPSYSGDFRIWRVKIEPYPKSGSFRLSKTINSVVSFTSPISYPADASTIQSELGLTTVLVGNDEFEIRQPQVTGASTVNVTAVGADANGLTAYQSKYGVLNLNTLDLELLLGGNSSATALLEIEVDVSGTRETIVQRPITVINDLIDSDAYTLVEWGDVVPADSVVRYDTSQALTTPQKAQVRTNIGALGSADLTAYTTKDAELESRLGTVETALTANVQSALLGADSPSVTNAFATMDDVDTKAPLSHTHTIANVTNLQTSLDGKASSTHTHTIANVTGLELLLDGLESGKADSTHSHNIADVTGLQTALTDTNNRFVTAENNISDLEDVASTAGQKSALDAAALTSLNPIVTETLLFNTYRTSQPNTFTANINIASYPHEIMINVGGVMMAVPARIV